MSKQLTSLQHHFTREKRGFLDIGRAKTTQIFCGYGGCEGRGNLAPGAQWLVANAGVADNRADCGYRCRYGKPQAAISINNQVDVGVVCTEEQRQKIIAQLDRLKHEAFDNGMGYEYEQAQDGHFLAPV